MPLKFNVQIDASAPFDAGHATHNLLVDAQASNQGNTVHALHTAICVCVEYGGGGLIGLISSLYFSSCF